MFDRDQLEAVVTAICERLDGEWLLIGGAIAALWFSPRRTTEDVDIVGLRGEASERYAVLEFASSLGLPVESMNSAADYFIRRIPDWRDHLVLFRHGARGRVYRPTATLFLLLKLRRLDERDLEDSRTLVATGEPFDRVRVQQALDALSPAADENIAARRLELSRLVRGS